MSAKNIPCKIINKQKLTLSANLHYLDPLKRCPAVLVLHGFTGYKDEKHIHEFATLLAEAGFVTLRFDTSGFGDSEGSIEKDFRVSNYLSDIEAASEFLLQQPNVDPNRLGICGHSMGAGLSIIAAALNNKFRACCAIQPSEITFAEGCRHDLKAWQSTGYLEQDCSHPKYSKIQIPWAFAEDRNKYDTREYAKKLAVPLMVMYGTADTTVPPEKTIAVYQAAPEPKELIRLDGVTHDFSENQTDLNSVSTILLEFFERQLKQSK